MEQGGSGPERPVDPVTGQPYVQPGPPTHAHAGNEPYALRFDVDYPDRQLNRLTTFFRAFTLIPITIVFVALMGSFYGVYWFSWSEEWAPVDFTGWFAPLVVGPVLLMILFRRKYPRWWFDWNVQVTAFFNRVAVYSLLMDDRYPSTDEAQSVRLEIDYPDQPLNRFLPLVKWLLAIPHMIVLMFYGIGVFVAVVCAWFAILFTGRYPRWAFDLNRNFLRWNNRVYAYMALLVTDRYPPFDSDE